MSTETEDVTTTVEHLDFDPTCQILKAGCDAVASLILRIHHSDSETCATWLACAQHAATFSGKYRGKRMECTPHNTEITWTWEAL